jgi:hypothetical protein
MDSYVEAAGEFCGGHLALVQEVTRVGGRVGFLESDQDRQDEDVRTLAKALTDGTREMREELRSIRTWLMGILASLLVGMMGLLLEHFLKT